ncbi:acyl-CoA dehydrogenase family protein [Burkholderiaceae bacterium FT117]|uniref:acyl-CoA dehydrogenase n=1 Tax=Zeimonas sediminis TaxID=2944268 RepID=UPI002342F329|nr:acyl-CoA dehydrogenase [Zeimonas sediminis]MCM5571393.1 acyl-CoA dehydrogenase family protein [Zeimonas sediminis]
MSLRDQLSEAVTRIAADRCGTAVVRGDEAGERPDALWRELAAAGLDRATASEAAGGSGLGWRDAQALVAAAGEFAMPVPLVETLGAHALARAAGCELGAVSAPAGFDGAASFARLVREGDSLVAGAVPWGDRVGIVVGVAADGGVWLLDAGRAERGDRRNQAGEVRTRMAWRAGDEGARRFERPPGGAASADTLAADSLACLAAALRAGQLAGAMRRVLAMTVRYAGEREQFGRPIGRFQAIQQQLALMAELVAQAAIGVELAFDTDGPLPDPLRAACAKQVASANALQCAAIAHAVHGAIGVTGEYDLQLFTRRLRAWAAEWGGAHAWAAALGRGLLGAGHASVWHAVIAASDGDGGGRTA